jgi:hypothetical protein
MSHGPQRLADYLAHIGEAIVWKTLHGDLPGLLARIRKAQAGMPPR